MSTRNRPNRAKVRSASGPIALKTSKEIARRPAMLLVLGMHRSGTSVCARILECLGAKPSANLMPPVPDNNEKGFFEDMDVYRFNESQLLPRLQRSWHSTAPVDWSCLNDGDRSRLAMEAVQIIRRNFSASEPLSILKEPRLAMLLPFWISVLTHAGYDIRIVCALRDPVSVARSLGRRDRLSTTHSGLLFTSYWLAILSCIKHLPIAFVQFDEIFTEPRRCLEKVARQLGLQAPVDFRRRVDDFLSDFLDKKLCHHEMHQQDLDLEPEMPAMTLELYRALLRSAQSQSLGPALKYLQTVEKEFHFLQPILQEFDSTKRAFWNEQAGVAQAQQQVKELESERSGLLPAAQEREELKGKLATLQSERDALAQEKNQTAAHAAQLEHIRRQVTSECDALNARLATLASEHSALATRHSSLATAFEQLQGQHSSLTREREALLAERDALVQEKNQSAAQAAQLEQARQQIAAQRDALAKERDELKAKLDALQSERDGLNARLATLGSENSELATRHSSLATAMDDLRGQHSSLATAFEQLQGQHNSLAAEREALLALRDALAQEKNQSAAQAAQLEQARQQIAAQRDALAKERGELKAKLAALQSERDDLVTRISALESEHSDLATRHKSLATEHEALLAERDDLAAKHAALEAEHQLALERRDAISTELETVTERRDELEEALQERFRELAELTKRLISAEDALQDTSQARDSFAARFAALEAEHSKLVTERAALLAAQAEAKCSLRRTEKALRRERHGSKEFSSDGWVLGPTSLGSSQHHPPYRHLNIYFAEVEGKRGRNGAVKFRLVEHNGHFGFCFFAGKGVSPALESWCACGEEGDNTYMLVVPETKAGARLLAQLTLSDRSLVNTALLAAERAIRARVSTVKTDPLLAEVWLPCAQSLREAISPKKFPWV